MSSEELQRYIKYICELDLTNSNDDEVGRHISENTRTKYHLIKQDYLKINGLEMIQEGRKYISFIICNM